ncbi:MAG: metal-dependent hydrolase [Pseudomonadota bacterium]|nr:metal-dependent hydrolase [Pseudomonadota bacterium]
MDTLTHALLGALVVRATAPAKIEASGLRERTLVGGLAAAFPDIDYLSFWIAPLTFLAEWHRGPTHSLVMLPIWAVLLGLLFAFLFRNLTNWRLFVGICALALLSHIASDLITAYGTQILWPITDFRVAFGTTFVIDPYFSALVLGALIASVHLRSRSGARLGLLLLAGYLGLQVVLQQQARALGEAYVNVHALEDASVHPLPQPLSPFNWLVIVTEGQRYHVALVNLAATDANPKWYSQLGWLGRLQSAYRPRHALTWKLSDRYGADYNRRPLAEAVWQLESFAKFRRFAGFPALYRIDDNGGDICVWYTDLRYVLPSMTPPFRYGMCGSGPLDNWRLFRLRRFTYDERQYLGGNSGGTALGLPFLPGSRQTNER